jgi:competence protein ComEA
MKYYPIALLIALVLATSPLFAEKVDINTADAQTLEQNLNGVGETKAEAIVAYRKENGKFKNIEELANVPGIGAATIEKNQANIVIKNASHTTK